jgi:glutathione S-transferase
LFSSQHALAIVYAQWFAPEAANGIEEKASANVQKDLDEIESALADGPYLCGQEFTAA